MCIYAAYTYITGMCITNYCNPIYKRFHIFRMIMECDGHALFYMKKTSIVFTWCTVPL